MNENLPSEIEDKLVAKENALAEQLKNICDKDGRENNPRESAKIFHKLGQIYRKRSPDKFKLIRSAGLFNGALVRKPDNIDEIVKDLQELISHVLREAGAEKQDADLITFAEDVKVKLETMRKEVKRKIEAIKRIPVDSEGEALRKLEQCKINSIKGLQEEIAKEYTTCMARIGDYCEKVMGEKPCKYALTGMGSLARVEITPYSDFENVILLEEGCRDSEQYPQMHKEYFRWFSVIFQIILINMQETIIPSLAIPSLNDYTSSDSNWFFDSVTPRGISFDGMMPHACKLPLGRPKTNEAKPSWELIKPVSEMLHYLDGENSLKPGYHLEDILTKCCFVFGNKEVFDEFDQGVYKILSEKSEEDTKQEVKKQLKNDITNFGMRSKLTKLSDANINVKQVLYRTTTLFISALGRLHNINASSCFEIISELFQLQLISDYAKHKLMYCVACACEARLRIYAKQNCQDDLILMENNANHEVALSNILGIKTTINYFQIAYALQCYICKSLGMKKAPFYSNLHLMNLTICYIFRQESAVKYLLTLPVNKSPIHERLKIFDDCLHDLENQLQLNKSCFLQELTGNTRKQTSLANLYGQETIDDILHLSKTLQSLEIYDEAVEMFTKYLQILKLNEDDNEKEISDTLDDIADCLYNMQRYNEAMKYYEKSLKIYKRVSLDEESDKDIATTLNNIGTCLKNMQHYNEAMQNLEKSLKISKRVSLDEESDKDIATTLNNVGLCLNDMQRYNEAMQNLEKSLKISKRVSLDEESDKDIATRLKDIGACLINMQRYNEAMQYLEKSLKISKRVSLDEESDKDIATTYNNISVCLRNIQL